MHGSTSIHTYRRRGFSLIDLVTTTVIGGLVLVIFAPAVRTARVDSRSAVCADTLRELGQGMQCYAAEHQDWIPGVNTSGVVTRLISRADPEGLQSRDVPVQSYDWMTPVWTYVRETQLPDSRAERWQTLWTEFKCPSVKYQCDFYTGVGETPDIEDIQALTLPGCSYLSPSGFAWWGAESAGEVLAVGQTPSGRPFHVDAMTSPSLLDVSPPADFTSRLDRIGSTDGKVFAADGLRYLTSDLLVDLDVRPDPTYFGAFAEVGAWTPDANAYGAATGSLNWDGDLILEGSESQGRNLRYSYRHSSPDPLTPGDCISGSPYVQTCEDNKGGVNGLFFDGHVTLMSDFRSRAIDLWYPSGSTVQNDTIGMTTVPAGYEIP